MFSLVDNFKGHFLCARTVKSVFKPSEQNHSFCRKETYPVFGTETSCYVNKWTSTQCTFLKCSLDPQEFIMLWDVLVYLQKTKAAHFSVNSRSKEKTHKYACL